MSVSYISITKYINILVLRTNIGNVIKNIFENHLLGGSPSLQVKEDLQTQNKIHEDKQLEHFNSKNITALLQKYANKCLSFFFSNFKEYYTILYYTILLTTTTTTYKYVLNPEGYSAKTDTFFKDHSKTDTFSQKVCGVIAW
jgi:hypothetical protein